MRRSEIFLSFFGLGNLPLLPISSTIIAWIIGIGIILLLGAKSLFSLAFAIFIIGIFEINKAENKGMPHNDLKIVIDEIVGVWIAMCVSSSALLWLPKSSITLYLLVAGALGGYLLFILWSPSTIGWIKKSIKGGLGVMLDDTIAGFAGGLLVLAIAKALILAKVI